MNTSQKKKPLLYIGLIAFLAIAVVGILYDFISKSGGMVAIISVVVAFLILAAVLVIDAVARKREAQQNDDDPFAAAQTDDNRFLRHTEESPEDNDYVWRPNTTARAGFAGFGRRAAAPEELENDPFAPQFRPVEQNSDFEPNVSDLPDGFDDDFGFEQPAVNTDSPVAGSQNLAGELNDSFKLTAEPTPVTEMLPEEIPAETPVESTFDSAPVPMQVETKEEDDMFKPVLKLTGTEPATQPEPEQPAVVQEAKPEAPAAETAVAVQPVEVEPAAVEAAAPVQQPVAPKPTAAERRAAAAVPAASTVSTAVGGQTIESFYEEMTDEDILYRDCVEVWAADAKPAALRLIKYVEGIEDKQTAALIGREVEYLNAMIDRINCFTQLEYIDELLEYRKHNYSTLVKDCLKRFSPFFMEKRLGLLWKGLDIDVMTDRRWFIFALTQVIFNAVEFTPNGGKIAISAKKQENYIDLTVEDSGKGISPDELPFIFMAGYMGDDAPNENGGRTGMGLFIAQSVMRKMGGEMLAESTPGKGTRITMRMPIIEPNA